MSVLAGDAGSSLERGGSVLVQGGAGGAESAGGDVVVRSKETSGASRTAALESGASGDES